MTNNTAVNPFADVVDAAVSAPGAMDASKEDKKKGFDRKPARAGVALFRLRSYIETGRHTVKNGQGKGKIQLWADLEFELVHPDHLIGPDDNKFPDTIRVRDLNISMNPKASYFQLFKAMNYNGDKTSFAQMLGDGFLGRVVHNKVDDKVYVNMREDGKWLIGAPSYVADPINAPDTVTQVPVPELHGDVQLFLWEAPGIDAPMVQRMWDSIEISGEKSDGTEKKNWIQDKIRDNLDWDGSFTQQVVDGGTSAAAAVDDIADTVADAAPVTDPLAGIPGL